MRFFKIILFSLIITSSINYIAHAKIAAVIGNPETKEIYFHVNKDTKNYPASLTKMMTLYLVFEDLKNNRISLSDKIKFSKNAANQSPSKIGIGYGGIITIDEAINSLIVKSANDTAVAIAENLEGSTKNFIKRMNKKAQKLNMNNTIFANPHGLPNSRNISSAHDMFLMASAIINDFPEHKKRFNKTSAIINGKKYKTHNKLITKHKYYKGIKTGYIRKSGFQIALLKVDNGVSTVGIYFGGKTSKERNQKIHYLMKKYSPNNLIIKKSNDKTKISNKKSVNYHIQTSSFKKAIDSKKFIYQFQNKLKLSNEFHHNIKRKGKFFVTVIENLNIKQANRICNNIKKKKLECLLKSI